MNTPSNEFFCSVLFFYFLKKIRHRRERTNFTVFKNSFTDRKLRISTFFWCHSCPSTLRKTDFYDRIEILVIFGVKIAENVWFFLYKLQYNVKIHDFFYYFFIFRIFAWFWTCEFVAFYSSSEAETNTDEKLGVTAINLLKNFSNRPNMWCIHAHVKIAKIKKYKKCAKYSFDGVFIRRCHGTSDNTYYRAQINPKKKLDWSFELEWK